MNPVSIKLGSVVVVVELDSCGGGDDDDVDDAVVVSSINVSFRMVVGCDTLDSWETKWMSSRKNDD
jgi:hypothetical protein